MALESIAFRRSRRAASKQEPDIYPQAEGREGKPLPLLSKRFGKRGMSRGKPLKQCHFPQLGTGTHCHLGARSTDQTPHVLHAATELPMSRELSSFFFPRASRHMAQLKCHLQLAQAMKLARLPFMFPCLNGAFRNGQPAWRECPSSFWPLKHIFVKPLPQRHPLHLPFQASSWTEACVLLGYAAITFSDRSSNPCRWGVV